MPRPPSSTVPERQMVLNLVRPHLTPDGKKQDGVEGRTVKKLESLIFIIALCRWTEQTRGVLPGHTSSSHGEAWAFLERQDGGRLLSIECENWLARAYVRAKRCEGIKSQAARLLWDALNVLAAAREVGPDTMRTLLQTSARATDRRKKGRAAKDRYLDEGYARSNKVLNEELQNSPEARARFLKLLLVALAFFLVNLYLYYDRQREQTLRHGYGLHEEEQEQQPVEALAEKVSQALLGGE